MKNEILKFIFLAIGAWLVALNTSNLITGMGLTIFPNLSNELNQIVMGIVLIIIAWRFIK